MMGGGGQEFKGVASADDEEDEPVDFHPQWTNHLAGDMDGHETGWFCLRGRGHRLHCGYLRRPDRTRTEAAKNAGDGSAFSRGSVITWDGFLTVPTSGEYTLMLQAIGGNTSFKIKLGDKFMTVGSTELCREGAQWPWGSLVATEEGMEIHGGNITAGSRGGLSHPAVRQRVHLAQGLAGSAQLDHAGTAKGRLYGCHW